MRCYAVLLFNCLLVFSSLAQTDSTSIPQELATAVVRANTQVIKWATVPSQSVGAVELQKFGASDFTPGMNRIPGVRFEQRTPGSYRISIRNTARRSPFGVRDVQVYWNGLPLTEPGGDTPLNFIDLANVDQASITKGPSSIPAGSPLGGSVGFTTRQDAGNQIGLQFGSFGQRAGTFRYTIGDSNATQLQVRLAHRTNDGHRTWSDFRRSTVQLSLFSPLKTTGSTKWAVSSSTHLLATRLDYKLPGALTPAQYAENPYQERPGSVDALASIDYENILLGTTFSARKNDWFVSGATYATGFRFDNPFNVNHKRETNIGGGTRGSVMRSLSSSLSGSHFITAGGDFQFQFRDARQYDPNQGIPGELQYSDDIQSQRLVAFAMLQGNTQDAAWQYQLGLSAVKVQYDVFRTYERNALPSQVQSDFDLAVSPRFQLTHAGSAYNVSISYATGSSTPSLREFRTNEGSLNQTLRPELGNSLELYGYYNFSSAFRLSANAYLTQLKQTITTFQDTSGIQLFRNAGRTNQPGLELAIDWQLTKAIKLSPAYTYQPYTYRDYEVDGTSFAGRPMPGLPTHTFDVLLHSVPFVHGTSAFAKTLYADLNVRYESENPLDDAGDVVADAFVLLRLQVGARFRGYQLFLAGDNLLDTVYSLGNDINPQFGNRYFQAAPPHNLSVGLSLDFRSKKA